MLFLSSQFQREIDELVCKLRVYPVEDGRLAEEKKKLEELFQSLMQGAFRGEVVNVGSEKHTVKGGISLMQDKKKKELLRLLKKERPKIKKFNYNVFVIEVKKVADTNGMLKFEWYFNDELNSTGSFIMPLESDLEKQAPEWQKLKVGENEYYALTFDMKAKSIAKIIGGFFKRSLEEGKFQDLLPWAKSKQ